jgi:hypothetical protein
MTICSRKAGEVEEWKEVGEVNICDGRSSGNDQEAKNPHQKTLSIPSP